MPAQELEVIQSKDEDCSIALEVSPYICRPSLREHQRTLTAKLVSRPSQFHGAA
jgi:hypothetical protein